MGRIYALVYPTETLDPVILDDLRQKVNTSLRRVPYKGRLDEETE